MESSAGFQLECLSEVKRASGASRRVAFDMAAYLIRHPTKAHDDLVAAYDEAVAATGARDHDLVEKTFADALDGVATMVASTEPCACVLVGKVYTLVLAPVDGGGEFMVLNVDTKRVEFTRAPEYQRLPFCVLSRGLTHKRYDVATQASDVVEVALLQLLPPPREEPPVKRAKTVPAAEESTTIIIPSVKKVKRPKIKPSTSTEPAPPSVAAEAAAAAE